MPLNQQPEEHLQPRIVDENQTQTLLIHMTKYILKYLIPMSSTNTSLREGRFLARKKKLPQGPGYKTLRIIGPLKQTIRAL